MNKSIKYKDKELLFHDLLQEGHNTDKFINSNTLFHRPDHRFEGLLGFLKKGDVVYDMGAYIGTFSLPMAIEGMEVYAFEGFPDNATRLRKNCKPYENIKVHEVALSNEDRVVTTKFNDCTDLEPQEREITYVIFDEYMEKEDLPHPTFVKMDIEGMETVALFGMKKLLEDIRPVWQIGYHSDLDIKFKDYPGFLTVEEGGFDFSSFVKLNYVILCEGRSVNTFTHFGEYVCIPKENNCTI